MVAGEAHAGCCTVTRADSAAAAEPVQVCEPVLSGACAEVLYEGDLAGGESVAVCSNETFVIWDFPERPKSPGKRGAADCDGSVIEL